VSDATRALVRKLYRAIPGKSHLFHLLRRGPKIPSGIYQHLHFEGPFEVSIDRDHHFALQSYGTFVENELFWAGFGGSWDATSLKVWQALCRSRTGLAIDIGANTGVYALAAAALGREAAAFEPVERMALRLRRNVDLNDFSIRIEQKAVSDRGGRMPIFDTMDEHNYSASLEGQGPSASSYEVEVCTLDDLLAEWGNPALAAIKIDVERHEPAVLRGMGHALSNQSPPMLIEILDREIGTEVCELIEGLEYQIYHIDEKRGLIPATYPGPIGDHNWNHLVCTRQQFDRAGLAVLLARSG